MREQNWNDKLKDALREVGKSFLQEELAFYALTSKIELPLRDKLAYCLFKEYNKDYDVKRECNRRDIVVFNKPSTKLSLIIECKATHYHSLLREKTKSKSIQGMIKDKKKGFAKIV